LYPDSPYDAFLVDELVDTFEDVRLKLVPTFSIDKPEDKAHARKMLMSTGGACYELLQKIESIISPTPYIVGKSMTLADISVFHSMRFFFKSGFWDGMPDVMDEFPKLAEHSRFIAAHKGIKEQYENAESMWKGFK